MKKITNRYCMHVLNSNWIEIYEDNDETGWQSCDSITVLLWLVLVSLTTSQAYGHCVRDIEWLELRWISCMSKYLDQQFPLWKCLSISSLKDDPFSLFFNFWSFKVWCQLISLMTLSLNLYQRFALWNFRAGWRKVGHISLDTFQAI